MSHLMRYGFIITLLITLASAQTYQQSLLNIHAKIFPKLILTDMNIDHKKVSSHIKIIILYREDDSRSAHYLKEQIVKNYPLLEHHRIDIELVTYDAFNAHTDTSAYYLLFAKPNEIEKVIQSAQKNSRLTFAYDSTYLDQGACIALDVGKKVMPYINLQALKKSNITLKNFIYQVAKLR